jgi:glycosyltransferase involved in cell wall biosynthesis
MNDMFSERARISAVITAYNSERHLAMALDSVFAQTLPAWEVIVVDDGSTDKSAEVVRRYGDRVCWHSLEHAGAGINRSRAFRLAGGDLVATLDADDVWVPDKLSLQLEAFAGNPAPDIVYGHVRQQLSPDLDPKLAERLWAPDTPVPGPIPTTMMLAPGTFQQVGDYRSDLRIAEAADWHMRACEAGLRITMLPDTLAWRRIHGRNSSLRDKTDLFEYPQVLKAALDRRRTRAGGHDGFG